MLTSRQAGKCERFSVCHPPRPATSRTAGGAARLPHCRRLCSRLSGAIKLSPNSSPNSSKETHTAGLTFVHQVSQRAEHAGQQGQVVALQVPSQRAGQLQHRLQAEQRLHAQAAQQDGCWAGGGVRGVRRAYERLKLLDTSAPRAPQQVVCKHGQSIGW